MCPANRLTADPKGLRVTRRVFATAAMQRYCKEEIYPGPQAQTDEDLLNHVRATAGTTFTMGPAQTRSLISI